MQILADKMAVVREIHGIEREGAAGRNWSNIKAMVSRTRHKQSWNIGDCPGVHVPAKQDELHYWSFSGNQE